MKVLIVAATAMEIQPFIDSLKEEKSRTSLSVAITGIGLTATTYSLTRQISLLRPDLIIQAGVGGCFDQSVPLGKVMTVSRDVIADQGVTEKGVLKTLTDMNLLRANQYPYRGGWLVNNTTGLTLLTLKKVKAISVNTITYSKQKINKYVQKFNPVIESMEGAAFHYVCLMEKIPFLQIRSVSNYAGERNKKKWDLSGAVINLNRELSRLLHRI